jgi:hypothetical protein
MKANQKSKGKNQKSKINPSAPGGVGANGHVIFDF